MSKFKIKFNNGFCDYLQEINNKTRAQALKNAEKQFKQKLEIISIEEIKRVEPGGPCDLCTS